MKSFLGVMLIFNLSSIYAAEIYDLRTGNSVVVDSCKVIGGFVEVKLCSSGFVCDKYDTKKFSCNPHNGNCKDSWIKSLSTMGWINLSKDELNEFNKYYQGNRSIYKLSEPDIKYETLLNQISKKCPFFDY